MGRAWRPPVRLALVVAAVAPLSCGDNRGGDVPAIRAALEQMPEVRVIDVVGWDEMWPFWGPEAIRADLQIGETGRLVLCNLTLESLKQGGPFIIARIGRWAPSASSNRDFGKARYVAGCPNSVDVAPESPFMQVTHISIDSPADAVTQYKELEAEIEAWPERSIRCRWGNTGWYIEYSKTLFRPEFVQ